jgi:hypothetical protein
MWQSFYATLRIVGAGVRALSFAATARNTDWRSVTRHKAPARVVEM